MGIDWGVPAQRAQKTERFTTPVVTLSAFAGKGSGRKISFNKAAVADLGLVKPEDGKESFVTFGRDTGTNEIVLAASLTENESMKFFKVNKSFSFSDKKTYEFIAYTLKLDTSVENFLHIDKVEGEPYYNVTSTSTENCPQKTDISEEEVEAVEVETVVEEETTDSAEFYSATSTIDHSAAEEEEEVLEIENTTEDLW